MEALGADVVGAVHYCIYLVYVAVDFIKLIWKRLKNHEQPKNYIKSLFCFLDIYDFVLVTFFDDVTGPKSHNCTEL